MARERTIWIVTNSSRLKARFRDTPGIIDILPSIATHLVQGPLWSGSETWRELSKGLPAEAMAKFCLAVSPIRPDFISANWQKGNLTRPEYRLS